jgi:hypothetical protein
VKAALGILGGSASNFYCTHLLFYTVYLYPSIILYSLYFVSTKINNSNLESSTKLFMRIIH